MSTLSIINELASTSKRLEKEAILKREQNNILLQRVFKATNDPTINYWIKQIPSYTQQINLQSLDWGVSQLEPLATRKVTGNAAIDHVSRVLSQLDDQDAEVIKRILDRDLDCGVQTATINKIWKKLIPEFTYMRCSLPTGVKLDKWDWKNGVYSQLKADSMFSNMDVYEDGSVVFTSRNGTVIPSSKIQNLVDAAAMVTKGTRTHGELMVEESGKVLPREIGNGILSSIAKGGDFKNSNQRAIYMVWDQIPLDNAFSGAEYKKTYSSRYTNLVAQLANLGVQDSIKVIPTRVVHSYDEALEHYQEMLNEGLEGTIIKSQIGFWKDGTSKDQVKMKLEAVADLQIVDMNEGKGKNATTFGSLLCKSSDGLLEVNVSGFSDEERQRIYDEWDQVQGKIIAVMSNCMMKPTGKSTTWSLFLPRAVEIRDDKTEADTLQQIKDQFESLIRSK